MILEESQNPTLLIIGGPDGNDYGYLLPYDIANKYEEEELEAMAYESKLEPLKPYAISQEHNIYDDTMCYKKILYIEVTG